MKSAINIGMGIVLFGFLLSAANERALFNGMPEKQYAGENFVIERHNRPSGKKKSTELFIQSGFGSIDQQDTGTVLPAGGMMESVHLRGWKGEQLSCKLLVWSAENTGAIMVSAADLKNGKQIIGKDQVSISVIENVLTDEFANGCGPRLKDKVPVHSIPDRLSYENTFSMKGPARKSVWISIRVPAQAAVGIYSGSIIVKSVSGTQQHPVTIEVQDKMLPPPAEWSFHLDLWQNPYAVARYHQVAVWSDAHMNLLRKLLLKLADAGQKCITTTLVDKPWGDGTYDPFGSMIGWTKRKDGTWNYDYTIFDKYVRLAMDCGISKQITCYSMVPITNLFTWYDEQSSKTVILKAVPGTPEYENLWKGFLTDFQHHLEQNGWLDITTLALDEREEEEMTHLFRFLKQHAPAFKISMAGMYYKEINSAIYDFSSNWREIPKISGAVMQARKNAGLKTTYYVACGIPKPNNFTFSPPAESCYEGWFAAAQHFDGFLRWAYNSWPENPVFDSRFVTWPSGDTYLMYPGAQSSVRFERLREGIQDYEKIRILRKELEGDASPQAVASLKKLNSFLDALDTKTLQTRDAAKLIREGKEILYEVAQIKQQR
jgi:hypothetical protein